jgi:hypothetical protein
LRPVGELATGYDRVDGAMNGGLDWGGTVGDQLGGMIGEERGEVSVGCEKIVGSPIQPTKSNPGFIKIG